MDLPFIPNPNPAAPNPNPNPTADLPTTISSLTALISLAESALHSASPFLPSSPFLPCPFDPRHRMPPESLFRHSLLCPSAPGSPLDLAFLDTLRYPTSLKSESHLQTENRLLPPPSHDPCYSLEAELSHIEPGFFYRDCPAVVTTPESDASARTFTLPVILSNECANFIPEEPEQPLIQILPSELRAVGCEAEAWRDYPASYSYSVLRVASGVQILEEGGLKKWVISSSYSYGILIDAAMRDHIFVLLKLCLKAVGREAKRSAAFH